MTLRRELINLDAEKAVLGAVLLDPRSLSEVDLRADEFGNPDHRRIFEAMSRLDELGDPVDVLTVAEELEGRPIDEMVLMELASFCPTSANIKFYAAKVRDKAITRTVIKSCEDVKLSQLEGDELLSEAQGLLWNIDGATSGDAVPASQAAVEVMDDVERAVAGKKTDGILTGCLEWDFYAAAELGDVTLVGARPSIGKTAILVWLIRQYIRQGHRLFVVLTEGTRKKLMRRLISSITCVNTRQIKSGKLNSGQAAAVFRAATEIGNWPLWFDDSRRHVTDICRQARRVRNRHGTNIMLLDYLQKTEGDGKDERTRVNHIVRSLRGFAADTPRTSLVNLVQLNRDVDKQPEHRPHMGNLSDSSELEKDADVIALIYRGFKYYPDKYPATEAEIDFNKVREGETGRPIFHWDNALGIFRGPHDGYHVQP